MNVLVYILAGVNGAKYRRIMDLDIGFFSAFSLGNNEHQSCKYYGEA